MDWLYVVLDDDPTGVQTVHDVSVYTGFDGSTIEEAFIGRSLLLKPNLFIECCLGI